MTALPERLMFGVHSFALIDEATGRYLFDPKSHVGADECETIAAELCRRWNECGAKDEEIARLRADAIEAQRQVQTLTDERCAAEARVAELEEALTWALPLVRDLIENMRAAIGHDPCRADHEQYAAARAALRGEGGA